MRRQADQEIGWRVNAAIKKKQPMPAMSPFEPKLLQLAAQLMGERNDMLHGGFKLNPVPAASLINALEQSLSEVETIIDEILEGPLPWPGAQPENAGQGLSFINFSNHPVSTWPLAQLSAAAACGWGAPRDAAVPFPSVSPQADAAEVARVAAVLAGQLLGERPAVVHVAGELTLTCAVVGRIQRAGVRCVAATTERVAEATVRDDGSVDRRSRFEFVRWRDYPSLADQEDED